MNIEVEIFSNFHESSVRATLPKLRRLRDDIEDDMKADTPVDSGELVSSIFCDLDELTGEITGGATADHAAPVELGHEARDGSFVEPQPFVRPAFLRRRGVY